MHGFRIPWLVLTVTLMLHVIDEARSGFLDFYNPAVDQLTRAAPYLPIPTFDFYTWLGVLFAVVMVLFTLTPFAGPGGWGMVIAGRVFAPLMLLNGVGHLGVSVWLTQWTPGTSTAPLLVAAAVWLWLSMPTLAQSRSAYRSARIARSAAA